MRTQVNMKELNDVDAVRALKESVLAVKNEIGRVIVADAEAAGSPLIRAAMGIAVQGSIEVRIELPDAVDYGPLQKDSVKTLVLVREVAGLTEAMHRGLVAPRVNLGNVHFTTGRKQLTSSVFLSQDELDQLKILVESGVEVEARAVPSDKAINLAQMQERFRKGA